VYNTEITRARIYNIILTCTICTSKGIKVYIYNNVEEISIIDDRPRAHTTLQNGFMYPLSYYNISNESAAI